MDFDPGAHAVQLDDPRVGAYMPGGQGVQTDAPEPENEPTGHRLHLLLAGELHVPAGHVVQEDAAVEVKVPPGQGTCNVVLDGST